MAGSPFPQVNENAREEALSSDLNRASSLASKALQEELRRSVLDSTGTPINCFTEVPSFAGVAATFNGALAAGEALVYDVTGIGANDSPYKVMQWVAQNLLFANPDGANPRIDLVVATPVTIQTDNAVRNILLDPVARTFAPASVPKTSSPTVVPVVVTGVPGATPAAPAIPAGSFVLFEVWVPAAAPDATTFGYIPRLFRKSSYPLTGGLGFAPQTGVLRGCALGTTTVFSVISGNDNAVVIDGEVVEFNVLSALNTNDTVALANPFGAAAPAGNDKPYFLYVVGGRNLPSNGFPGSVNPTQPVCLVASLTPPNIKTGRPTAPIGAPRGVTSSACYVGLGFVRKNTTANQVCKFVGDRIYCATNVALDLSFENQSGITGSPTDVTLASAPSISDEAVLALSQVVAAALTTTDLSQKNTLVTSWGFTRLAGAGTFNSGQAVLPIPPGAGPHLVADVTGAGGSLGFGVIGYKMNVRRLGL